MKSKSRLLFVGFLLATVMGASCSSCESCSAEKKEQADASATPDVVEAEAADVVEDTYAEKLAEAKSAAEEAGDSVAFAMSQKARFMAAELEGQQKKVDGPKVKKTRKPKYDDDGQIDTAKLKQVLRNNQGALQKCYERALKADPALMGSVQMTIRIGPGGKVLLARASSNEIGDRTALECMERRVRKWNFPSPTGGTVIVRKGYRFTPQN